ncbi:hypothetical protein DL96DRAFT_1644476 [Flagelloscypha sp. PMI_526]|nr:hypothetical protein DL96DRAFT_1644476 [Flagelloscypha sp. PMI_526]
MAMNSTVTPHTTSAKPSATLRHAVNTVVAPLGLGIFMSMFLFGGVTVATRSYLNKCEDRLSLKILVVFIWCMMLAHVILGVLTSQDMVIVH